MRMRAAITAALLAATTGSAVAAGSSTPGPAPYHNPHFRCPVHRYGNGNGPNIAKTKRDPLCVEYNKRDITADDGGALRFLEAEPARFAVAGKCEYWQRDHWRIRLDRGYGAVVAWDGSYWWDVRRGEGAGILRHFRIAGQPVGAYQAAAAIATVSPAMAKQIRQYGAGRRGGGGASATFPADPSCSSSLG